MSVELSSVLGAIIAKRLPTNEARPWRKALAVQEEVAPPRASVSPRPHDAEPWPIEAVLLVYPSKRTYGQGELILWELKLIGGSADHGLFLEVILPAMEEASYISDPPWHRPNKLWGRFDIHSVYVARGPHWEPLVSDGRLDLRYRASPRQWMEGLSFEPEPERKFNSPTRLTWLTPFDLAANSHEKDNTSRPRSTKKKASVEVPTLQDILKALISRMRSLIPELRDVADDAWDDLRIEEQPSIRDAMEKAEHISILYRNLKSTPKDCPGRWTGTQIFSHIPPQVIPYLELASIFHIGRQTHLGCGTFTLIRSTGEIA